MPPVRTLQFTTSFEVGGTERHVVGLARRLDRARFDVRLACLRNKGAWLAAAGGPPPASFPIDRLYGLAALRQQRRLAAYLKAERIAVVHSYGFYANVFAVPVARIAGVPVVVASIRDMGDLYSPAQRRVERWVCRLADRVLVNAATVRERLVAEGHRGAAIRVIRNGIEATAFARPGAGAETDRGAASAPHTGRLVTVVSRLTPGKGIEHFLDCAAILAGRYPDLRFLVAGDGPARPLLEARARRLGIDGRVELAGMRLDVPAILARTTVSVLPSLSEALPNAVLEAMAAGTPVVATRVGGVPELIHDGVHGLLVAPGDGGALAGAVARLLDDGDLAARLARAARARVAEQFTIERMVRETEDLYTSLIGARRGGA